MADEMMTEKDRAELYRRWTGGGESEPIARVMQDRARPAGARSRGGWRSIGPTNVGGRLTCLAVDPGEPKCVWAGSAGGGVWWTDLSRVAGGPEPLWERRWRDDEATLAIGSLAIDPTSGTIYCGTGEANLSNDSMPGAGLFTSEDRGASWKPLVSSDGRKARVPVPRRIGSVALDPASGNLWLAGIRLDPTEPLGGIYHSPDRGTTWRRETLGDAFDPDESYQAHAVLVSGKEILVAVTAGCSCPDDRAGIWFSGDGGGSWQQAWRGDDEKAVGRIAIARCAGSPHDVYALVATAEGGVWGVFRSDDGGEAFSPGSLLPKPLEEESWMTYNCTIAVHPDDAGRVIFGGIDLYQTFDWGRKWRRASRWTASRGDLDYAHADHHALAWVVVGSNDLLYDANDGGLDLSRDGGYSFENRSDGLVVTQFYDVEVDSDAAEIHGGGTQDNGTVLNRGGAADSFVTLETGDGGWLALESGGRRGRWATATLAAGGFNVTFDRGAGSRRVYFPEPELPFGFWAVPIEIHPKRPDVAFVASDKIYRTGDFFDSWSEVTAPLDYEPVVAIRVSPADDDRIYAATAGGRVVRSVDGGYAWTFDLARSRFEAAGIGDLCCSPDQPDQIFVCLTGCSGCRARVWRSDDAGRTWKPLEGRGLPTGPLSTVCIGEDGSGKELLVVAGLSGVWTSADGGASFDEASGGLPNTLVTDLVYTPPGTWTAATYGRGLWQTKSL